MFATRLTFITSAHLEDHLNCHQNYYGVWFSYIPVWLDLLNAFKLTTSVPTSNHNLFCCCSSLYQSLALSERKVNTEQCSYIRSVRKQLKDVSTGNS